MSTIDKIIEELEAKRRNITNEDHSFGFAVALIELENLLEGMVLVPESILDYIRLREGHLSNYGRYIEARSYEEILDLFDCMLQASKEGE